MSFFHLEVFEFRARFDSFRRASNQPNNTQIVCVFSQKYTKSLLTRAVCVIFLKITLRRVGPGPRRVGIQKKFVLADRKLHKVSVLSEIGVLGG